MFEWSYYLTLFIITMVSTMFIVGILRKQRVHSKKSLLFPYKMIASLVSKLNIGIVLGLFVVVMVFVGNFVSTFMSYSSFLHKRYFGHQEINQFGGFVHRNF